MIYFFTVSFSQKYPCECTFLLHQTTSDTTHVIHNVYHISGKQVLENTHRKHVSNFFPNQDLTSFCLVLAESNITIPIVIATEPREMEAIQHHGNNLERNDNEVAIDNLVNEIVNVPEGFTCFLCQVTNNAECIWSDIMDDIVSVGLATESNMDEDATEELRHRAARYACYWHYIFTISSWTHGQGRICIPLCIEHQIRLCFPGNGEFVGFRPNQN